MKTKTEINLHKSERSFCFVMMIEGCVWKIP